MRYTEQQRKILILAEGNGDKVASITFELLRAGKDLLDKLEGHLCAAVLGLGVRDIAMEIARYSDEVYYIDNASLASFQTDLYLHALENLCCDIHPSIILMGHTLDNLDLAPRLACRLGTKLITDSTGFDIEPGTGNLLCTKPVYGDNAVAVFKIERMPRIATLRPKVMKPLEITKAGGQIIKFDPKIDRSLKRTELLEEVTEMTISLDKADVIIAGGRGIKNKEGLKLLEDLAEILKNGFERIELGASRPLIEVGFLPSSRQVGLTGEKVSPQLYIGVGISGASQHLSGILGSKKIVAINKDREASIFRSADYGVVGEYENVIPALINKLRELL